MADYQWCQSEGTKCVRRTDLGKSFISSGRSFTYMLKSIGPKTDPCGT